MPSWSFNPFFRELLEFVGYSVIWPWSRLAFRVVTSIVRERLSQKSTCMATLLGALFSQFPTTQN